MTESAPDTDELLRLLGVAGRVADHSSLRPWRVVALRSDARRRLGDALAESATARGEDPGKVAAKPLRAPLLLAIVVSRRESEKVPAWEQEAVASGVAHVLSLLLDEAGWGVMWRTGGHTRSEPVRRMHGLSESEDLLGWLYIGGVPEGARDGRRVRIDAAEHLTTLD